MAIALIRFDHTVYSLNLKFLWHPPFTNDRRPSVGVDVVLILFSSKANYVLSANITQKQQEVIKCELVIGYIKQTIDLQI
ncbi:hypothetical protein BLOT_007733 [Blomia tropicalis]|nr:hypothetical protein BLOT_007733 [Blomia tropicalis]